MRPEVALAGKPINAPKTSPPIASAPLPARNAVGVTRLFIPAASSFVRTDSTVVFGFSLRTKPASESAAGATTRSRNCGRWTVATRRKRPYVAARCSESERSRAENVANSPTK